LFLFSEDLVLVHVRIKIRHLIIAGIARGKIICYLQKLNVSSCSILLMPFVLYERGEMEMRLNDKIFWKVDGCR